MNYRRSREKEITRQKLNILGPGVMMLRIIGIACAFGILFWALEITSLCVLFLAIAAVLMAILFILIVVEAYRDDAISDLLLSEFDEYGEDYGI